MSFSFQQVRLKRRSIALALGLGQEQIQVYMSVDGCEAESKSTSRATTRTEDGIYDVWAWSEPENVTFDGYVDSVVQFRVCSRYMVEAEVWNTRWNMRAPWQASEGTIALCSVELAELVDPAALVGKGRVEKRKTWDVTSPVQHLTLGRLELFVSAWCIPSAPTCTSRSCEGSCCGETQASRTQSRDSCGCSRAPPQRSWLTQMMKISVLDVGAGLPETISVMAEAQDSIEKFKKQIEEQTSIPPEEQLLMLCRHKKSEMLEDCYTLFYYKIVSDTLVHLSRPKHSL